MEFRLVLLTAVAFRLSIGLTHASSALNTPESYPEVLQPFNSNQNPASIRKREDVPLFLLELYRRRSHLSRGRLNELKSEAVRVFFRERFEQEKSRGPLHRRFFFNLSAIRADEKVTKAELRMLKKKPKSVHPRSGHFQISIFRLKQNKQHDDHGILVTSQIVKSELGNSRWLSFDVTTAVKFWRMRPSENFGLGITINGSKQFPSDFHIGGRGRREPFLVAYTKTTSDLKKGSPDESKEDSEAFYDCEVSEREENTTTQNVLITTKKRVKRSSFNRCQRRWFYVQFSKLKWNWIIAPRGFSANYCEGSCPRVLDMYLEPTNHAILQNILHRMDKRIPSPSCVPTKLHSISVLYRTSDKSIALTVYAGMVVSTCGCR